MSVIPHLELSPSEPSSISIAYLSRILGGESESSQVQTANYVVLPSVDNPRWVFPVEPARVRRRGLDLYSPATVTGRVAKRIAQLALWVPKLWLRSSHLSSLRHHVAAGPLRDALTVLSSNGREIEVLASIGTPGPTQKVTLLIVDRDGTSRGIIKIGASPVAAALLSNEAAMLRWLVRQEKRLQIPQLLWFGRTEVGFALLQNLVPVRHLGNSLTAAHWGALQELASNDEVTVSGYATERQFEARLGQYRHTLDSIHLRYLDAAIALTSQSSDKMIACVVHGDFAPWNIGSTFDIGGQLSLYDWEYGSSRGLPLFDAIHFIVSTNVLLRAASAKNVRDRIYREVATHAAIAYLDRVGVAGDSIQQLVICYLLEKTIHELELTHQSHSASQTARFELLKQLLSS